MEGKMKAAVMTAVKEIKIEERQIPIPKDNEILMKVKHVGVCGSDLHIYEHGKIGTMEMKEPLVLGHESAGEVIEIGKDVKNVKIGDLVALEPQITCGKCEFCKSGRYNLCPDVEFMAVPGVDGAFAEYVVYPSDMAFKLPTGMTTLEGALMEPLSVGLHAVHQSGAKIGQTAVILGSGCIGLVTLMTLKAIGVSDVYVVDLIPKRLEKAKELGATEILQANKVDVIKRVMELTKGQGADLVFETAGSKYTTQQTIELVKRGGTITLIGMPAEDIIPMNMNGLIWKEAKINTVFRYRNLYPVAIKAVASGLIPLKNIASDVFKFGEIKKGLDYNLNNKNDVIKAVIEF